MANGLADILSAYREGLRSERETRLSEMQMALSMLEAERGREFQREQLRRDDAYKGLSISKESLNESIDRSSAMMYSQFVNIFDRDSDGVIKPLSSKQIKEKGLSDKTSNDIYKMVSYYETEGMKSVSREMAMRIGRQVSAGYRYEQETNKPNEYISELTESGLLYGGEDDLQYKLSYQPFLEMEEATDVLANVDVELSELAHGDYDIQRITSMTREPLKYETDITSLADLFEGAPPPLPKVPPLPKGSVGDLGKMLSEKDDLTSDIRELSSLVSKKKSLQRQGFDVGEEEISKLANQLSELKSSKNELLTDIRIAQKQSEIDINQQKIEDLASDILLESGLEQNEQNLRAARSRATDIAEVPGSSMFGESTPGYRQQRPFYDIYGRIQR